MPVAMQMVASIALVCGGKALVCGSRPWRGTDALLSAGRRLCKIHLEAAIPLTVSKASETFGYVLQGIRHTMRWDLCADWSCRDRIAKRERRGNRGNGLRALADALYGDVAIVHKAAKNALVYVDALDLVEAHLEGPPLDETGLVNDSHVGDVGLRGPAMEPSRRRPVQGRKPSDRRQGQANPHQHVGRDHARKHQKHDRHDPCRDCGQKKHPVLVGRIQHPLTWLQDFVNITSHGPALD